MSLPRFAVQRPVFASMVALIVVVIGVVALSRLRIDLLPAVEVPTLTVSTSYEGADPEVVERLVTSMVEEIISTVPGVTELSSESSEGRSRIRVTFAWGSDLDSAASDVRARLEEELSELPDDIDRPQIRKFDVASFPVVLLGVASEELDPVDLTGLVEGQIRHRFARLPGVAQVDLWGGFDREIRIGLDPDKVLARGLALSTVITALRDNNVDLPAGSLDSGRFEVVLRSPAEFTSLDQLRDLVVAKRGPAVITLGQVATVADTHERESRIIRLDGEPAIRIAIRKEADANTVEVAQAIMEEVEATNRAMPQVRVVPVIDQGDFIVRSIDNVVDSVLVGGSLAVLILLLFLRSFASTVVIGLAIPLSMLVTMALVYGGGLTLNLMTLGGLALAVGMMVDSAIVVLENIFQHRERNDQDRRSAAIAGTNEVAGAIFASTITTLVIFLPLVFVTGVAGLLFRELALVVVYGLIASLAVALTLVPMLAARLPDNRVRDQTRHFHRRLLAAAGHGQEALERRYRALLERSLGQPLVAVAASTLALALSLWLWPLIGSEFLPPSDEGEVRVRGTFEQGMRLDLADRQARKIEAIVFDAIPERRSAVTSVSAAGRRGNAEASMDIRLNVGPANSRERSNSEIANSVRQALDRRVAGVEIRTRAPQGQFLLQRLLGGDEGLEVEVRGDDFERLGRLAERVSALVAAVPGVTSVDDDIASGIPQEHLVIDRERAADLGLSVRDVAAVLEVGVSGRAAADYRPEGLSVPIRVQLADAHRLPLDQILMQEVRTPAGAHVPLRSLVSVTPGTGPASITRKDQRRTITLSVDTSGRPPGDVAVDIERALAAIAVPIGSELRVVGSYEEQEQAFRELVISFLLALVLVYMVLACQYESLRDPLVVMFSVPVAAIGVIVTLAATGTTMNVQSGIGCIMLGGIVVNNAILLVDQAGRLRHQGLAVVAAVAEAGRRRLRPILMTTSTTILGLAPLALGIGEGADAQAPLARAVVGGLLASTLITLVLVPSIYVLVHPEPAHGE